MQRKNPGKVGIADLPENWTCFAGEKVPDLYMSLIVRAYNTVVAILAPRGRKSSNMPDQDPEPCPCRSDSSQSAQENLCYFETWTSSDETPSTLVRPLAQRRVSSNCDSHQAKCNACS